MSAASQPNRICYIDLSSETLSTHLQRPKQPASKLSNVEFGSDSDNAVDLTTPPLVSGNEAGPEAFPDEEGGEKDIALAQAMAIDEEQVNLNNPLIPVGSVRPCAPLPLPTPPPANMPQAAYQDLSANSEQHAQSNDAERRPQGERAPKLATIFSNGLVADYCPWTGDSSEDVLNENVIRSGYADKPPGSNQSESHTARPSLWPNLKQKNGLPILSALLVQVMEKRQASGRCTAPSTFKPPPRVTLTDAKREAWLRDLAASDVPLRRLSRTIPHGVRGRALLDQCLGKKVPISRALWLAKCVGANELRAFRRKGVSGAAALVGENKWVREWTILVEQFMESVIVSCGQDDWRNKMNYSVRLVTAFFAENLLDNDHYLDWLLTSFRASSTDQIPIWIVLVQVHWRSLVGQQRRGRALAEALLAQLHLIDIDTSTKVNSVLLARLRHLLIVISSAHNGCMIAIQPWTKYRAVLAKITLESSISGEAKTCLEAIILRNDHIRDDTDPSKVSINSAKSRLVGFLDGLPLEPSLLHIVSECHRIISDFMTLVQTLLEWACSRYGTHPRRIQLATRILRHFKETGLDIETAILSNLSSLNESSRFSHGALKSVVGRLVLTGHFGYGRYLLWLISHGGLNDGTGTNTGLLTAVSDTMLTPRLADLRQSIIGRLGLVLHDENETLNIIEGYARQLYEAVDSMLEPEPINDILSRADELSTPSRLTLGARLQISGSVSISGPLSSRAFNLLRAIFEHLQDFESLAALVRQSSMSQYAESLASAADTVNMNAEVFGAMGILNDLVMNLCNRQRTLRSRLPFDRAFLLSLTRLAEHCQLSASMTKSLAADLAVCEQQVSSAACSPASDNMVLANAGIVNSDADIDRILLSGNTMDEQLMARLFSSIVERCVKQISTKAMDVVTPSRWFTQLRAFDRAHFDRLAQNLLTKLAGNAGLEQIRVLLTALVGSNCMEISVALQAWDHRIEAISSTNEAAAARLSLAALQVFLPRPIIADNSFSIEGYRFRLAQTYVCRERAPSMIRFLKQLLSGSADLTNLLSLENFQHLLRSYAVKHLPDLMDALSVGANVVKDQNVRVVIQSMLSMPSDGATEAAAVLASIMKLVDDFSLPVCKIALRCLLPNAGPSSSNTKTSNTVTAAFKEIIQSGNPLWPQLIDAMPIDAVHDLHKWGLEATSEGLTQLAHTTRTGGAPEQEVLKNYMAVTALTAAHVSSRDICDYSTLLNGLAAFEDMLREIDVHEQYRIKDVCSWLDTCIRFVTTIVGSTTQADLPSLQQRGRLLFICCNLLCHAELQAQQALCESLFDVASFLASGLNPDQLASVARQLSPANRLDARLGFLLGTETPIAAWLVLVSRSPTTNVTSSPNIPQGAFQLTSKTTQSPTGLHRSASQSASLSGDLQSPSSSQPKTPTTSTPQNRAGGQFAHELKYAPFMMRPWEMMPDPTTSAGQNDASLSLTMFAARRAI
ncbi:hypothetical protein MBLNU457_4764t2 [Dothideomycetes sp. NU457]